MTAAWCNKRGARRYILERNLDTEEGTSAQEDAALIRQAREGRPEAFRRIVENNQGALFSLSLRLLGDRQEAEDVVQETFLRLYRHLADFKSGHKLSNWLYTIALNISRNRLRRRKVLSFFSLEAWTRPDEEGPQIAAAEPGVEDGIAASESSDALDRMIQVLPGTLREPFLLRYMQEMPDEEIAGVLGVSLGNVRVRIHRAKARLWERFGGRSAEKEDRGHGTHPTRG